MFGFSLGMLDGAVAGGGVLEVGWLVSGWLGAFVAGGVAEA
jgi:hypothetical protein